MEGWRPNEPVEVVIRPEDLQITLPEEGKLQVKVDTQLFRGVHYEIIAYDELGNEWMIHSTRQAIVGEEIGLDFEPEDIHVMRLNETKEEFDARIEEIRRSWKSKKLDWSMPSRRKEMKKTTSKLFVVPYMLWIALFVLAPLVLIFWAILFQYRRPVQFRKL